MFNITIESGSGIIGGDDVVSVCPVFQMVGYIISMKNHSRSVCVCVFVYGHESVSKRRHGRTERAR